MAKWIEFVEVPAPGVTKRWEVRSKQGDVEIARIQWSNGWRRYVLQPGYPTEWEQDCLRDVAEFLETQTREHKASRTAAVREARDHLAKWPQSMNRKEFLADVEVVLVAARSEARAATLSEVKAMVEGERQVIMRDVQQWGWNVQKCASESAYSGVLAGLAKIEGP